LVPFSISSGFSGREFKVEGVSWVNVTIRLPDKRLSPRGNLLMGEPGELLGPPAPSNGRHLNYQAIDDRKLVLWIVVA